MAVDTLRLSALTYSHPLNHSLSFTLTIISFRAGQYRFRSIQRQMAGVDRTRTKKMAKIHQGGIGSSEV